jgi:hypothetical protein
MQAAKVEQITIISGITLRPAVKFYAGFDPKLSPLYPRQRNKIPDPRF